MIWFCGGDFWLVVVGGNSWVDYLKVEWEWSEVWKNLFVFAGLCSGLDCCGGVFFNWVEFGV